MSDRLQSHSSEVTPQLNCFSQAIPFSPPGGSIEPSCRHRHLDSYNGAVTSDVNRTQTSTVSANQL